MFSGFIRATFSGHRLLWSQQIRTRKATFRLKYAYGASPKITDEEFTEAQESGELEELRFSRIRFQTINETCSYLYDRDYARLVRYVMKQGNRALAEELVADIFYNIKSIQYTRMRKRQEKLERQKESDEEATNVDDEEDGEIELNPLVIFKTAIKNAQPTVITLKQRRGGATYTVPFPISSSHAEFISYKWFVKTCNDRPKPKVRAFSEVMAQELIDAFHNRGRVIKMRDDLHKLAAENKAFAHFRWR